MGKANFLTKKHFWLRKIVKKMFVNRYFWSKKTFVTINLGKKNDFGQKIFLVKTIFDKKIVKKF